MKNGFTLIELMVVVLIIGVLASMSVPYYMKTVETTKAGDAATIGNLIGNANRMYQMDNPGTPVYGQVTNYCNSGTCPNPLSACQLVARKYIAQQDWNSGAYDYFACDGGTGGGCCGNSGGETGVACVSRKNDASGSYAGWGYRFYSSGRCEVIGSGAPPCPKF
jgi:prepilin-type N-terminal cleavage/methylation domain-containing protein